MQPTRLRWVSAPLTHPTKAAEVLPLLGCRQTLAGRGSAGLRRRSRNAYGVCVTVM